MSGTYRLHSAQSRGRKKQGHLDYVAGNTYPLLSRWPRGASGARLRMTPVRFSIVNERGAGDFVRMLSPERRHSYRISSRGGTTSSAGSFTAALAMRTIDEDSAGTYIGGAWSCCTTTMSPLSWKWRSASCVECALRWIPSWPSIRCCRRACEVVLGGPTARALVSTARGTVTREMTGAFGGLGCGSSLFVGSSAWTPIAVSWGASIRVGGCHEPGARSLQITSKEFGAGKQWRWLAAGRYR